MIAVPLAGIVIAASVPLVRHFDTGRREQIALDGVREVRAAQERFKRTSGGYATHLESLAAPCGGDPAPLAAAWLDRFEDAGYDVVLTAVATGAPPERLRDCHGRPLAADYYLAAAPRPAVVAAQEAFAARSWGDVYLFYDGVAPTLEDMATGLPTPAAERDSFKIP